MGLGVRRERRVRGGSTRGWGSQRHVVLILIRGRGRVVEQLRWRRGVFVVLILQLLQRQQL